MALTYLSKSERGVLDAFRRPLDHHNGPRPVTHLDVSRDFTNDKPAETLAWSGMIGHPRDFDPAAALSLVDRGILTVDTSYYTSGGDRYGARLRFRLSEDLAGLPWDSAK